MSNLHFLLDGPDLFFEGLCDLVGASDLILELVGPILGVVGLGRQTLHLLLD